MLKRLQVKHPLFLSDFNKYFFSTDFRKSSYIKFHQNPSSGSRVVPCGQTDMTNLIVVFRNFANEPKNVLPKYSMFFLKHHVPKNTLYLKTPLSVSQLTDPTGKSEQVNVSYWLPLLRLTGEYLQRTGESIWFMLFNKCSVMKTWTVRWTEKNHRWGKEIGLHSSVWKPERR